MDLGTARSLLRQMLGDQSQSVWSDSDLNSFLNRANIRIHRRLVIEQPELATTIYLWDFTANSEELPIQGTSASVPGGTVRDTAGTAVDPIISIERLFWKRSGLTSYHSLPIRSLDDMEELTAGSNVAYDLLSVIPAVAGGLSAYVIDAYTKLLIRPTPQFNMVIKGYVNTDIGESALSSDSSDLLNGKFLPLHDAVMHDAGFLATFKDESLREEFMVQREDVMRLHSERALTNREAY